MIEYKISSLFFESFCECQNCYAMFWDSQEGASAPNAPTWLRAWLHPLQNKFCFGWMVNGSKCLLLFPWCSFLTDNQVHIKRTTSKLVNARCFHLKSPQNVSTKREKRKLWEPALCCEDLVSRITNSLMLWQPCAARIKDFLSFTNGPTFSVLAMLRIETLPRFFPLLKEQRNSSAKECVTKQKSKTRLGNYSRPKQAETSLRAVRKQRHATILRTSHMVWREQSDQVTDCYFCITNIRGFSRMICATLATSTILHM